MLHAPAAEQRRGDAVEGGGLVQPNERVRLEPVPAHAVTAVDERHPHVVGMVDQGVVVNAIPVAPAPTTR